jgi:hypothetical protein
MSDAERTRLLDLLEPVLTAVADAPVRKATDAAAAALVRDTLEAALPFEGETIQAIGRAIRDGVAAGWLCDRGEPDARFCRLAKPTEATANLSVDVVALQGPALRHRHPAGEVTLAFAAEDGTEGRFDGHPPGWVVMPAGSTHTPTVTGDRMHLMYFLPDGSVDWKPAD